MDQKQLKERRALLVNELERAKSQSSKAQRVIAQIEGAIMDVDYWLQEEAKKPIPVEGEQSKSAKKKK